MKTAGVLLIGFTLGTCAATAQTDTKPNTAAEALALANVEIKKGTLDHHAEIYRIGALLVDEQFEALEIIADEYRESQERWGYGWWKLHTFYMGCEKGKGHVRTSHQPVEFLGRFDRWITAHPDSATAKIATAKVRLDLAWRARGGDWAYKVSDVGWAGMHRHLDTAWELLEEAEALDTSDPELYAVWIEIANGLNKPKSVVEDLYQKGLDLNPGYAQLYMARAWYLMPRWHGEPGELEAFAEQASIDAKAVPGTGAYAWIAHKMLNLTEPTAFIHEFDWSEPLLRESFADILAVYPNWMWIQHLRARICGLAEDKEEAQKAFAVIGGKFDKSVWPDEDTFARWIRWAEDDGPWPGGNGIHYGVRMDNPIMCQASLNLGAEIDAADESGFTPLHYAAYVGSLEAARFLIKQGADVNDRKDSTDAPVYTAAQYGHPKIVALFLEHGADPNAQTKDHGQSPLIAAASNRRPGIIKILLKHPDIEVNAVDQKGRSPFYFAGARGRVDILKLLIEAGADINNRSASGETALSWARKNKKTEAAKFLRSLGAPH